MHCDMTVPITPCIQASGIFTNESQRNRLTNDVILAPNNDKYTQVGNVQRVSNSTVRLSIRYQIVGQGSVECYCNFTYYLA